VTKETTVPWRWTAPEVHELSYWCQATDVWAFGVTFWEVFTNALIPFYDISDDTELRHRIFTKGERLPRPASCGTSLYAIMQHCWAHEHRERPTFADLVKRLQNASSALVRDGDLFEL
jgi:serine/threonine protein kinase